MSESFNDLWASSNPVKSQQPQVRTLGEASRSSLNVTKRTALDPFDLLASAGSSQPNSRPITPSIKQQPIALQNVAVHTGDAFGGLVSFGGSTSRDGCLTIAERAAKAERDRNEKAAREEVALKAHGSFWDQYENSPVVRQPLSTASMKSDGDEWALDLLGPGKGPSASKQSQPPQVTKSGDSIDTWNVDLEPSAPGEPVASFNAKPAQDILEIDQFAALGIAPTARSLQLGNADTPRSFDFGDQGDGLLGAVQNHEDDDILGSLAKPVEAIRRISPEENTSLAPIQQLVSRTPSASPPPHVVGRIVEMGFSVQQAKAALAATSTGVDVDAALEMILQNIGVTPIEDAGNTKEVRIDIEHEMKRRSGPSRSKVSPTHSPSPSQQLGLQDQADKLLAQASTIGITMFSKANAFWKEGRDKVVKVYEEQRLGTAVVDAGKGKDTARPRWLGEARATREKSEDFVNEDEDLQSKKDRTPAQVTRSKPPGSLFAEEELIYRSPARRRPPASISISTPSSSSVSSNPTPPTIIRPTIEVSPSAVTASNAHKTTATEHFKLGRFAEAEAAYSRAIAMLPASHLLSVRLHNNRSLTRLKTGDYKGTIDDTSEVIRIVTGRAGKAWHPGKEAADVDTNLGDAVGKALRRRAEAHEGLEKWRDATADWERLSTMAWVGHSLKRDSVKNAARCRRMAAGGSGVVLPPGPPSKPKSTTSPARTSSPVYPSEALSRVRATNTAQEEEDQARHDLKDVVDVRLANWRAGKETNLRALIASLDAVLWPSFGWQKVGMGELVSPGQVKVRYIKAIAKLHPDKLDMSNTTLEQRMIANGVFGTLNEAWNAFR